MIRLRGERSSLAIGDAAVASAVSWSDGSTTRRGKTASVLHHGYETSGWIVHAAKSLVGCWSALT